MKQSYVKRLALLLLLAALLMLCTACGDSGGGGQSGTPTSKEVPAILNQTEYVLYQNIFANDTGSQYVGQEMTKHGVFTTIQDAYNGVTRYYVWGYLDNTRCCDWQWELKVTNTKDLPSNGSLVTVKGVFTASEDALDGYWLTNPEIATVTRYVGESSEVDMYTMSDTLERVQILNILNRSEAFEGKQFSAYGRVASLTTLEDPYYDGSWQVPFTANSDIPAFGTTVVLRGTVKNGALEAASLTALK